MPSRCTKRRSRRAITCHCSPADMAAQRAISSSVRRQPEQNPSAAIAQILMQGDTGLDGGLNVPGAAGGFIVGNIELWGPSAYSSTRLPQIEINCGDTTIIRGNHMKLLENHRYALITGIVLAVILAILVDGSFTFSNIGMARWTHTVAGIFWIGLLYYFNTAQIPALADAAADKGGPGGAGITKYVAPRALFWFRWAAVVTWLAGAWLLDAKFMQVFTFGAINGLTGDALTTVTGIGAWLGTIMLLNVWVFIWPNQKKVLGITPATDDEKAKARRTAMLVSRTNFVLSIPMLMCMGAAGHAGILPL